MAEVLGDRLRRARRRRFVGRKRELALIADALALPEAPFAVAFVHGPGGVGKSALLHALEDVAGAQAARVDLQAVEASPQAVATELAGRDARRLLLLDTYEAAPALDGWLREAFLPGLPAGTVVVIAGRDPPGPAWEAWRELLRVVPLGNLEPGDARALLRAEGVDAALHDRLLALSHGHPLALALLVDVVAQDALPSELTHAPDVVRALLERFLTAVPDAEHRRALQVCAQARVTTESLLRETLELADARALFDWLRGLSFVDEGPRGVFPHDLARDALAADARWRDAEGDAALRRRVHDRVLARIRDPATNTQQAVGDLVFLHRDNPFTARLWDWSRFGEAYADGLRPGDPLPAMAAQHEGDASAELVEHWMRRQPDAFIVFRGSDGTAFGFTAMLALHQAAEADLAADPGAAAMWEWTRRHAPARPGEAVFGSRFFMDAAAYQDLGSRSLNAVTVASTQRWLGRRNAAWELLGGWREPESAAPMMAYIGFERAAGADFVVDGRSYGVYAHDWRRMDPERWLEVMAAREAAQDVEAAAAGPAPALSHAEFAGAVRQALRDLHRPEALAGNPLTAARLVGERTDASAAEVLEALLRAAVASLGAHPRDEKLQRALDRTYLRPAATQERAAELLGLPMSTYRRHLKQGVERVAERLWERELSGK